MIALLFRDSPTTIDSMEIDAVISENYTGAVEKTQHPIEKGADVTDHIRPKPDVVAIEGYISNTPISLEQARRVFAANGLDFVSTSNEDRLIGDGGYAAAAYRRLRTLKNKGTIITVQTAYETFTDMVLTNLSVPRNAKTGDGLEFTATFEKITFVENKLTTVVVAAEPKAKNKVDLGAKAAVPVDKKPERERSDLKKVLTAGAEMGVRNGLF